MNKGLITIGVLITAGACYYLVRKIQRENFKEKCLKEGGSLIGQWQCDYTSLERG